MKQILKIVILFFYMVFPVQQMCAQTYITHYNAGQEALKQNDFKSFANHMVKADSLRPNHPVLMYNLAKSYALNERNEESLKTLKTLSHFYASDNILDTTDFRKLINLKTWRELAAQLKAYQQPFRTSEIAFEITKTEFHPEGIYYDQEEDDFYLTDIRNGYIYKINKEGNNVELVSDLKDYGFWSAMGITVDPVDNNVLWITTSAAAIFSGFTEDIVGKSALLKLRKSSGELIKAYVPKTEGHLFGDLVVSSKGKVYISDSINPDIYTVEEKSDSLIKAFSNPEWWNLQGLAFSDDEKSLFVSDYILGIFKIDIHSGVTTPLITENERLRRGDGIYQKNDELFIIQNGSTPSRIASIRLDEYGMGIPESLSFPDQARQDMEEPTLGTWVGSDLYFVGNSPWSYYNDDNEPRTIDWPLLKIFKLKTE